MESMKVKITKQTVAGKKTARIGDEIDVPKHEGRMLVSMGKAEPMDEKDLGPGPEDINDETKVPPPIEQINPNGEPPSRVKVEGDAAEIDAKAEKKAKADKKAEAKKYAESKQVKSPEGELKKPEGEEK